MIVTEAGSRMQGNIKVPLNHPSFIMKSLRPYTKEKHKFSTAGHFDVSGTQSPSHDHVEEKAWRWNGSKWHLSNDICLRSIGST